ncbi:aldo/keto reductase [Muricoccus radiodurans]|uniref:aldo/keto reductase n=1 Tax=Muricoccus radiodurans TaxID=2231721 RepID=UPI003CF2FF41
MRICGRDVRRIGYGAAFRVAGRPATATCLGDRGAAHRILRRAVELGADLLDTADSYGPALSEELVAEALRPYPPDLLIATKGGVVRTDRDRTRFDGRPDRLRAACEASLRRLGLDAIPLYQLHWADPAVPFADQVGALADLRTTGKIRHLGLCNIGVAELEAALAIAPVASVQCRYGPGERDRDALIDACTRAGIPFIAYGPLAALQDPRRRCVLRGIADRLGATPAQVALAWVLQRAPNSFAIPGTLNPVHLAENMEAARLRLPDDDWARLAA